MTRATHEGDAASSAVIQKKRMKISAVADIIEQMEKQKRKSRGLLAGLIIMIIALVFAGLYILVKNKMIHVNELCISSRDVVGVDISWYQGDVNMDQLSKQGVSFIYIKATEGASHTDSRFRENWIKASQSNLMRGAYHFFSFESSGAEQAKHFIEVVGDLDGNLIPVVDVEYYENMKLEPPAKEDLIRELHACLNTLEAYYNIKPMIYCSRAVYRDYLAGEIDDYPMWVRSIYLPAGVEGWKDWTMWQYSDTTQLDGYSGGEKYIDMNVLSQDVTLEDLTVH